MGVLMADTAALASDDQVTLIDHPLVADMLAELRDRRTTPPRFRALVGRLGELLAYEATRHLPLEQVTVQTPLEACAGQRLRAPITLVPILRAGLGLAEGMSRLLPSAQVGHIGLFRDEAQLSPVWYYEKVPASAARGPVLLVDPMLATGGSAVEAVRLLHKHGCRDIRFVCILAAPEGLTRLRAAHPAVPIFTAAIDRQLNEQGYILPGLGDAGDRIFGTTG